MRRIQRLVAPTEDGMRLDALVRRCVPELTRRQAAALCSAGAVELDQRRGKKGEPVRSGAEIIVSLPDRTPTVADPEAPLVVVFERPDLVVLDKPAGQPTAPLGPEERGTLVNALLARFPDLAEVGFGGREPGILHRLDNGTSGLVVAARNAATFTRLRRAITEEQLEKRYLAIVEARDLADAGGIDAPIAQHPRSGRRVFVAPPGHWPRGARAAATRWQVITRHAGLALLEISAPRAMRHQIRAHLAAAGHPILGDGTYGGTMHPALPGRHALHASLVSWGGDAEVAAFTVRSPLPPELAALLG